ncbi:Serine/threonine-protein kinase ulk3 [Mortierella sp. NVP41]|nr:Serine/threonine-protein kinase ulk3 [Mortierella sp. NVP41]
MCEINVHENFDGKGHPSSTKGAKYRWKCLANVHRMKVDGNEPVLEFVICQRTARKGDASRFWEEVDLQYELHEEDETLESRYDAKEATEGKPGRVLEEKDAKRLGRNIAMGLAYLYGKGIAHCDVKPKNVLLQTMDKLLWQILEYQESLTGKKAKTGEIAGFPIDDWISGAILHELLLRILPSLFGEYNLVPKPSLAKLSKYCRDAISAMLYRHPGKDPG